MFGHHHCHLHYHHLTTNATTPLQTRPPTPFRLSMRQPTGLRVQVPALLSQYMSLNPPDRSPNPITCSRDPCADGALRVVMLFFITYHDQIVAG